MRNIELKNDVILKSLLHKEKLTDELNELSKQEEKAIATANKLMAKLAKENEKVLPLMEEEKNKIELGEYEQVSRTYLEDGKAYIEIADRLEEFKATYAKNNDSDSSTGKGDSQDNVGQSTKGDKDNSSKG